MEITPGLKFNDIIELMTTPTIEVSYGITKANDAGNTDGGHTLNAKGRILEIKSDLNQILVVNELAHQEIPFDAMTHVMYKKKQYKATILKDSGDLYQWWVCQEAGK